MIVNGTSLWSIKKFIPVRRTRNCNCACFTYCSAKTANIFQNLTLSKNVKSKEILVTRTDLVAKKIGSMINELPIFGKQAKMKIK